MGGRRKWKNNSGVNSKKYSWKFPYSTSRAQSTPNTIKRLWKLVVNLKIDKIKYFYQDSGSLVDRHWIWWNPIFTTPDIMMKSIKITNGPISSHLKLQSLNGNFNGMMMTLFPINVFHRIPPLLRSSGLHDLNSLLEHKIYNVWIIQCLL